MPAAVVRVTSPKLLLIEDELLLGFALQKSSDHPWFELGDEVLFVQCEQLCDGTPQLTLEVSFKFMLYCNSYT